MILNPSCTLFLTTLVVWKEILSKGSLQETFFFLSAEGLKSGDDAVTDRNLLWKEWERMRCSVEAGCSRSRCQIIDEEGTRPKT